MLNHRKVLVLVSCQWGLLLLVSSQRGVLALVLSQQEVLLLELHIIVGVGSNLLRLPGNLHSPQSLLKGCLHILLIELAFLFPILTFTGRSVSSWAKWSVDGWAGWLVDDWAGWSIDGRVGW